MSVSCSDVAVDIFVESPLISVMIGVMTDIGVGVLMDVNTNVLSGVMTAVECDISEPFKEFCC